jgi:hypothetical protein
MLWGWELGMAVAEGFGFQLGTDCCACEERIRGDYLFLIWRGESMADAGTYS